MTAMLEFERTVRSSGVEANLIRLVEGMSVVIDGCAYCAPMPALEARADRKGAGRIPAWCFGGASRWCAAAG